VGPESSQQLRILPSLTVSTASFLLTPASYTRKVVYDHTHIASYRRWGARSVGSLRVRLLALDGRDAELAGGCQVTPFFLVCAEQSKLGELEIIPSLSRTRVRPRHLSAKTTYSLSRANQCEEAPHCTTAGRIVLSTNPSLQACWSASR
jgi:hypothetical protein